MTRAGGGFMPCETMSPKHERRLPPIDSLHDADL
jgi:hypothetical protein